jgi:ribulose-phosphate 3-epimerase
LSIVVELVPSILSADFARLADEIAAAERGGGTVIHVDVMDGHFVPNITVGPPIVQSLRKHTKLPLDCHLMIENPDEFIPAFADAGANWVSVHYEACRHLHRTLEFIAQHKMQPAVVINPHTEVDLLIPILGMVHHVLVMSVNPGFGGQPFIERALTKLSEARTLRDERNPNCEIEVDGGIGIDNIERAVEAGADVLVGGSSIFGAADPQGTLREMRSRARSVRG